MQVTYLGPLELKNIRDAVHIYQVSPAAAATPQQPAASPATPPPSPRPAARAMPRAASTPFDILIMGDFSGRASRSLMASLAKRADLKIDPDGLDRMLARVELRLPVLREAGSWADLRFASMDADRIARDCQPLRQLADLRKRLLRADAEAGEEIEAILRLPPAPAAPAPETSPGGPTAVDAIGQPDLPGDTRDGFRIPRRRIALHP